MKFETAIWLSIAGYFSSGILAVISYFNGIDYLSNLFAFLVAGFLSAMVIIGIRD